jgi:ferredoxin
VEAMMLITASDPQKPAKKKAKLDYDQCLGCGVCLKGCSVDALKMEARGERIITPVNSVHRIVLMAIERGKPQNLLFDNQVLLSHRAMAAVLGVFLNFRPRNRYWPAISLNQGIF